MKTFSEKKDATKPAVIFIPGTMGTELFREDSHRVWPPDVTSFSHNYSQTYMNASGSSISKKIIPGLPFQNVYGKLYDVLEAHGYNVYYFGYDWRLDNRETAKKLKKFIDDLPSEKVHIVAHSMGGLITAEYLKKTGTSKIGTFIAVGTPFLGMPGALKELETGTFLGDGLVGQLSKNYFKKLLRNLSTWYQLLPGSEYFELGKSGFIDIQIKNGKNVSVTTLDNFGDTIAFMQQRPVLNQELLKTGLKFKEELTLADTLQKVDTWILAGIGKATIQKVRYEYDTKISNQTLRKVTYETTTEGDGTVSVLSATLGGTAQTLFPDRVLFFEEIHGLLLTNDDILEKITAILGEAQ